VAALRNGTIGWTLAGQSLDRGQTRKFTEVSDTTVESAAARARDVADRAGVKRTTLAELDGWRSQIGRTTYFFDTRTPEEFAAGHLPGFRSTPGGQLVQETEMVAPVRGARIVLVDRDGVRANMTASWLAQMAWDVCVVDGVSNEQYNERGDWAAPLPPVPKANMLQAEELTRLQKDHAIVILDLSKHAQYVKGHIAGARYVLRSQFKAALGAIPRATHYVLVCTDGVQSSFAAAEIADVLHAEVSVLAGGTKAWAAAGYPLEQGATHLMSEPIDRYKRPYEGTDNAHAAMQAYLDWEFGLVEQLGRDGTHHFWVL
jgi:rhodanese-related sulfurtransferase